MDKRKTRQNELSFINHPATGNQFGGRHQFFGNGGPSQVRSSASARVESFRIFTLYFIIYRSIFDLMQEEKTARCRFAIGKGTAR
jgi:hypothetical protein